MTTPAHTPGGMESHNGSAASTASGRGLVAPVVVAGMVFLLCSSFGVGGLATDKPWGDVGQYERYSRLVLDGEIPYRDYYTEYPPGAFAVFVPPAVLTDDETGYLQAFKVLMTLMGLASLGVCAWILGRLGAGRQRVWGALLAIAVSPLLLGHVYLNRYDQWPALIVAVALAALLGRRFAATGALLALGFAAKVYAVSLIPLVAINAWRKGGVRPLRRAAVAFAVTGVLLYVFFLVVAFGGLGHSYRTQLVRGLQIESVPASVLLVADEVGIYDVQPTTDSPGSIDLGGLPAKVAAQLTSLVQLACLLLVPWLYRRGPESDERLVLAVTAAVAAVVVPAKVISPQYLTWLIPLVPLVAGRRGLVASALLLTSLGLTQWELQGYVGLSIESWAVWVLAVRNVLLIALLVVLLEALARPSRSSSPELPSARAGRPVVGGG